MFENDDMVSAGDHALARRLAAETGALLVDLLADPTARARGWSIEYLGDLRAHEHLVGELAHSRPDDAVLSEEGHDDRRRLASERVWIVDPLDGSSDYGWSGQWAVHVGLVRSGVPVAGAVAIPSLGQTFGTDTASPSDSARSGGRPRVVVARSRRHVDGQLFAAALGAEVIAVGSAGVKAMAVVRGEADAYVHGAGMYEWDSCAPVAVAAAAGLHCSTLTGDELRYNKPDPWSRGLVICRPELADGVLTVLSRALGTGLRSGPEV